MHPQEAHFVATVVLQHEHDFATNVNAGTRRNDLSLSLYRSPYRCPLRVTAPLISLARPSLL